MPKPKYKVITEEDISKCLAEIQELEEELRFMEEDYERMEEQSSCQHVWLSSDRYVFDYGKSPYKVVYKEYACTLCKLTGIDCEDSKEFKL